MNSFSDSNTPVIKTEEPYHVNAIFIIFFVFRPSELYKKWVRAGESLAEDIHDQLGYQSLSGVFIVGIALAVLCFLFLLFENKLFSMGFIYRHLNKFENGETYERGRRRFSVEVHRKLLELKRPELPKSNSMELPDISNYLERTRKTRASIHALYNPARTRNINDERRYSATPANGSAMIDTQVSTSLDGCRTKITLG